MSNTEIQLVEDYNSILIYRYITIIVINTRPTKNPSSNARYLIKIKGITTIEEPSPYRKTTNHKHNSFVFHSQNK
jgi:hypothetical protein